MLFNKSGIWMYTWEVCIGFRVNDWIEDLECTKANVYWQEMEVQKETDESKDKMAEFEKE